jgi:Tfp pilus assembly protein PilV
MTIATFPHCYRSRHSHRRAGQSIVEVMLALSMLTMGFLGIAALLSKSFFLNRVTSDQLTATYLASEGLELAKNLSDHDVYTHLAGQPGGWGSAFVPSGMSGNVFQLDYTTCTAAGVSCSAPAFTGAPLLFNPSTYLYSYVASPGSVTTGFVRRIEVVPTTANMYTVHSKVIWSTGPLTSQTIDLEDHFYNWHP